MEIGKDTSGFTIPCWFKTAERIEYPPLNKNINTEICIIGAGISGLTTAYQLICQGKFVIILDDGRVASGESGRSSAHLTNILDDRYYRIEQLHGSEIAQLAARSHSTAIQFIEEICKKENIECEFQRINGYLFLDKSTSYKSLDKEFAITQKLGFKPHFLHNAPANTFNMGPSIRFPDQAQFHPIKYLTQLAKIIVAKGGMIFENSKAVEFKSGKPILIETNRGFTVNTDNLVLATNVPINNRIIIHNKQEAKRTYVIGALIPKNSIQHSLYWDTATPYHYIRIHADNYEHNNTFYDLLIAGGEDHHTGKSLPDYKECFSRLEAWSKNLLPQIFKTVYQWSGQIIEPIDYLAFIGHNPFDDENVYIATGDSGNGLTHGTIAGILIADIILHKKNEWQKIYKPSRKSFKKWNAFIKLNLQTLLTYSKYLMHENISHTDKIVPGEGAVINRGLAKVAIYRDYNGVLHECSAICPHLKAPVSWNSCEKTWDCPAHGSRFAGIGTVINGPANHSLKKLNN